MAKEKRLFTVGFHLNKILEQNNLINRDRNLSVVA